MLKKSLPMKQLQRIAIVIAMMFIGAVSLAAQESQIKSAPMYYVEVYENSILGLKSVCINYGVNAPAGKAYKIMDEKQAPLEFENAVGALNYLGQQGWELVSVYERDMKSAGRRTFYLLRLDVTKNGPTLITEAIDEMLAGNQ
jgi:hypothetical protein